MRSMRACGQTASFTTYTVNVSFQVKINGFSEQDQENLYNVTQAGKSAGKKGLGKSNQGKPIGGAKWEGKKTVLGEEDGQPAVLPESEAKAAESQGAQHPLSATC